MRPVLAGIVPYAAINDSAYDLADFVFMNEVLDVRDENQWRADEARRRAQE